MTMTLCRFPFLSYLFRPFNNIRHIHCNGFDVSNVHKPLLQTSIVSIHQKQHSKYLSQLVEMKHDKKKTVRERALPRPSLEVKFPSNDYLLNLEERRLETDSFKGMGVMALFKKTRSMMNDGERLMDLYDDLCDEVDAQEFIHEFLMDDTYLSWFMVMELHIYLITCRIVAEKNNPRRFKLRDAFHAIFWDDAEERARRLTGRPGTLKELTRKQLVLLFYQYEAAFYSYDEGLQTNDQVLAAAIWRRIFAREYVDVIMVERLVKYFRVQVEYLSRRTLESILNKQGQLVIPLSEVHVVLP